MALYSLERQTQCRAEQRSLESAENSSADGSSDEHQGGNAGWANSIAKVLSTTKPKTKKTLVLSRAKKSNSGAKNNEETDCGFEVDGVSKEEKPSEDGLEASLKQAKNQKLYLRVKPSWKDIDRERTLRKTATRGVVQLFNTVRIQQKDLQHQLEEAGPLHSRKQAVLNNINKRKFLDVLMSGRRSKSEQINNAVKNKFLKDESSADEADDGRNKKSEWNVLRDDFMTNKKIKHWDEDASEEEKSDENH